jgi:hypothetical protein
MIVYDSVHPVRIASATVDCPPSILSHPPAWMQKAFSRINGHTSLSGVGFVDSSCDEPGWQASRSSTVTCVHDARKLGHSQYESSASGTMRRRCAIGKKRQRTYLLPLPTW